MGRRAACRAAGSTGRDAGAGADWHSRQRPFCGNARAAPACTDPQRDPSSVSPGRSREICAKQRWGPVPAATSAWQRPPSLGPARQLSLPGLRGAVGLHTNHRRHALQGGREVVAVHDLDDLLALGAVARADDSVLLAGPACGAAPARRRRAGSAGSGRSGASQRPRFSRCARATGRPCRGAHSLRWASPTHTTSHLGAAWHDEVRCIAALTRGVHCCPFHGVSHQCPLHQH